MSAAIASVELVHVTMECRRWAENNLIPVMPLSNITINEYIFVVVNKDSTCNHWS